MKSQRLSIVLTQLLSSRRHNLCIGPYCENHVLYSKEE